MRRRVTPGAIIDPEFTSRFATEQTTGVLKMIAYATRIKYRRHSRRMAVLTMFESARGLTFA
jgi:hypothetical protein